MFGGIIALFNAGIEASNHESFCISCHAMRNTVYQEFKDTAHFANSSGVRASCADCHVPRTFVAKLSKKVLAIKDVYHTLAGTIDTKEKFEARRYLLAKRVWREMKDNNSLACRNCHQTNHMVLESQDKSARKKHKRMINENLTCIDCHKGIAHELPEVPDEHNKIAIHSS